MTDAALVPSVGLTPAQRLRSLANWMNGSTALGLMVAAAGRCRIRRGPRDLWLADAYRFAFPRAGAFSVGNVLITADAWSARVEAFPDLLAHEERHTWQYVLCGGLPFLPLYGAATAWSVLRTGDRAARNVFERRAGLVAGGYADVPVRSLAAAVGLRRSARA